jgi:cation diffusion facilitator family transporter
MTGLTAVPPAPAVAHGYGHQVQRVLWITLGLNLAVALAKFIVGLLTHNLTLLGDSAHSSVDAVNNVVGLVAVGVAAKEADDGHPYGHSKFETLAAFVLSGLLFLTCAQVAIEAVKRIVHAPEHPPQASVLAFAVAMTTLLVNLGVSTYEARRGRALGSDFLVADAAHTRSDVLVTATVVASLVCVRLGYTRIDAYLALVVAGFIGRIGYQVFRATLPVLVDASAVPDAQVQDIVRSIPGVHSPHAVRSRRAGNVVFVEMHVLVESNQDTETTHALTEAVEAALTRELGRTTATIHVETSRDCGW